MRSPILNALSWCRSIFIFLPLIVVYTIISGTLSLICSLFERNGHAQHRLARAWAGLILKTVRSPAEVVGLERVDLSKPQVYAANHLSALDIPTLYACLPFRFGIIVKKELFRYPFLGWHLRRSGQLAIDRSRPLASARGLKNVIESLRKGIPIVIFPEGSRSKTGELQPFLSGAFYFAIKAQVDVVPLTIVGTYRILPPHHFHIRPGRIRLFVGEPVSTAGMGLHDLDTLAAQVRRVIEQMYQAHRTSRETDRATSGRSCECGWICNPRAC